MFPHSDYRRHHAFNHRNRRVVPVYVADFASRRSEFQGVIFEIILDFLPFDDASPDAFPLVVKETEFAFDISNVFPDKRQRQLPVFKAVLPCDKFRYVPVFSYLT